MKQLSMREQFTHKEVADAYNSALRAGVSSPFAHMAKVLTGMGRGDVTRHMTRGWVSNLDDSEVVEDADRAKTLVQKRNQQISNNQLRRDHRALVDRVNELELTRDVLESIVDSLNERKPQPIKIKDNPKGLPMTVEMLLSDLQIGKLGAGYDTGVAQRRLKEYGEAAVFQIKQKADAGYRVERIVLALLGDIIESSKKHANSAKATDTDTAEQIHDSIVGIMEYIIDPLASLGIPFEINCIAGNHDWDDHGIEQWKPGRRMLAYPIYKGLELICKRSGYHHVHFNIPDGVYMIAEIYGHKVLYEHGVGIAATESAMKAHKIKRSEQQQEYISLMRMADKHVVTFANAGQFIVNGAFFGATKAGIEYSEIAGYSSVPAQVMCFHVPRHDARSPLYDIFIVQLEHVV